MSLLVWLPLVGDLKNKGASGAQAENHGATVDNNGKIGKCYKFDGTSNYFQFNNLNIDSKRYLSLAFWCYSNNGNLDGVFVVRQNAGTHQFSLFATGLGFRDTNHGSYTSFSFEQPSANVWTHYAIIYNDGIWIIYKNGDKIFEQVYGSATLNTELNEIRVGLYQNSSGLRYFNGKLNDFRIYDHALSTKEVKEISKGLLLHYKLDDAYIESTVNLLDYSNLQGHGSLWTLQSEAFEGTPIYKNLVTNPNTMNNAGFSIRQQIISPPGLATATKVTLSFYKRLNVVYGKNLGGYIRVVTSDSSEQVIGWSYNKANWANDSDSIGIWEKITSTVNIPAGCTAIKHIYVYVDRAPSGDCDFSQIQLELKDHSTPYVNGTRNQITIFDSSGYDNDGAIQGSLSVTNNSSRYKYSTLAKDTSNYSIITCNNFNLTDGPTTISFWSKPTISSEEDTSKIDITFSNCHYFTYVNYTYFVHNGDYKYRWANPWSDGKWHFVTCLFNGTDTKIYIDGINISVNTYSPSTDATTFLNNLNIKFKGNYLSDFRIYSTALSDDDIKALYNKAASIDNEGSMYSFEFIENELPPKISKNGITSSKDFFEYPDEYELYDYIQSSGTQWIDTLYVPNANSCVYLKFKKESIENTSTYYPITCVLGNDNKLYLECFVKGETAWAYSVAGSEYTSTISSVLSMTEVEMSLTQFKVNGNVIRTANAITVANTDCKLLIFAYNSKGTVNNRHMSCNLYEFKCWENINNSKVLKLDLVPAKRISDNAIGMWDKVNNNFYMNSGTGTFTLGNPIKRVASMYADKIKSNRMYEF